eukprot:scaffold5316_cov90-Skeletonema_dohrnii-CCMP3373.AAC.10
MSDDSSSSSTSSEESDDDKFLDNLQRLRDNDPTVTRLVADGSFECIQYMTDDDWEQLGRDISNSNCLQHIEFSSCFDDHKMTFFFRGLTRSSSIRSLGLFRNEFGFNGIQSMVPFLQNANNLLTLDFYSNDDIQTDTFNLLFRALRDSPITNLCVSHCGLDSIEIDGDSIPNNLQTLNLANNEINADGCRELAKLLRKENSTLEQLSLWNNNVDDEGISILVNALRTNTSLTAINLHKNERITIEGIKLLLKLVNDISSIKATLQSNHTLTWMNFDHGFRDTGIGRQIKQVLDINKVHGKAPDAAGKLKVILTQLDSKQRSELCHLQGFEHSDKALTEVGALLMPEVLEIVGDHHDLSEFYESFCTSVADLWTTINREAVLQQKKEEITKELDALAAKKLALENQMADVNREIVAIRQQSEACQ